MSVKSIREMFLIDFYVKIQTILMYTFFVQMSRDA